MLRYFSFKKFCACTVRRRTLHVWTITHSLRKDTMKNVASPELYWGDYQRFISDNYELILRVASDVDKIPFFNYSKKRVIQHLQFNVKSLVENSFKGASALNLLHGQKGIGKSCGLLLGTIASALLYPNLVAIYVEYSGK